MSIGLSTPNNISDLTFPALTQFILRSGWSYIIISVHNISIEHDFYSCKLKRVGSIRLWYFSSRKQLVYEPHLLLIRL